MVGVVLGTGLLASSTAWGSSTSPVSAVRTRPPAPAAVPSAPAIPPATEAPSEPPVAQLPTGARRETGGWRWPLPAGSVLLAGFDQPAQPWLAGHRGVDLLAQPEAPVRAVASGVVHWVGVIAGVGSVSVLHDGGIRSTYQPLDAVVTQGDRVVAGQLLGRLDLPGSHCAPRACLHLGALLGRVYLDPALLLGDRRARLLPLPLPAVGQS